jgi:hypothetical protein
MTTRSTIRGGLLAAAATTAALTLTACGSSSSGADGASTTASAATTAGAASAPGTSTTRDGAPTSAERARLSACLQQHGVTLPQRPRGAAGRSGPTTPNGPGGGFRGALRTSSGGFRNLSAAERARLQAMRAAFQACGGARFGRFRGGFGGGAGPGNAPSRAALRRFVACMRANGVELPAPNTSGRGPIFDSSKIDRSAPAFQRASRACLSVLRQPSS